MARVDSDSWDIASSVGATATMVAAARAIASREPDALIDDPFAEPLVRAVGLDFFTRLIDGEIGTADDDGGAATQLLTNVMAVRTRFFDDFFTRATAAGGDPAGGFVSPPPAPPAPGARPAGPPGFYKN